MNMLELLLKLMERCRRSVKDGPATEIASSISAPKPPNDGPTPTKINKYSRELRIKAQSKEQKHIKGMTHLLFGTKMVAAREKIARERKQWRGERVDGRFTRGCSIRFGKLADLLKADNKPMSEVSFRRGRLALQTHNKRRLKPQSSVYNSWRTWWSE